MSSPSKKCKAKQLQSHRVHHQNLPKKGKEIDNLFDLPYLPTPILFDILSRLQIKPLFNCRLVCKRWASIISTSQFSQLHLLRSPTNCLIQQTNIYNDYQLKVLHMLDAEYPFSLENKLLFKPMINFPNVGQMAMRNSCNGLVCFVDFDVYSIYVCNPVLREYLILPNQLFNRGFSDLCFIFGFSQKTNQYKVVLQYDSDEKELCVIYRFGEGSWKNIQSTPCTIWNTSYNALLNGCLHWMSFATNDGEPFIGCFDFDKEQFHLLPEPSEFGPQEMNCFHQMCVGVLNGNLSICYSQFPDVVIWVMKNYGVKESWSKDFVINCMSSDDIGIFSDIYEPIMIKGNGEVLMIFNSEFLILYDTRSQTCKFKQQILGENLSTFHAVAYAPSLISLKDVAKGENVKVLGRNK